MGQRRLCSDQTCRVADEAATDSEAGQIDRVRTAAEVSDRIDGSSGRVRRGVVVEDIVARAASEGIRTSIARYRVIVGTAVDDVSTSTADEVVVAAVATDCRNVSGIRVRGEAIVASTTDHRDVVITVAEITTHRTIVSGSGHAAGINQRHAAKVR